MSDVQPISDEDLAVYESIWGKTQLVARIKADAALIHQQQRWLQVIYAAVRQNCRDADTAAMLIVAEHEAYNECRVENRQQRELLGRALSVLDEDCLHLGDAGEEKENCPACTLIADITAQEPRHD